MSSLILPRRFYNQPQVAVAVDPRHDAKMVWLPTRPVNMVDSKIGSRSGCTVLPTTAGLSATYSAIANTGDDFPDYVPIRNNSFSFLVVGAFPSAGQEYSVYTQRNGASPYEGIYFVANSPASGAIYVLGSVYLSGGLGAYSDTSACDGKVRTYCGVVDRAANTSDIFVDGISRKAGGQSNLSANCWSLNQSTRIGNHAELASTGYNNAGYTSLIVVWDRALTLAEVNTYSANPWQIFKRNKQRLYFDVSTGLPTLTNIAASNITSSGARLTVN